jgi:hypothetical protein
MKWNYGRKCRKLHQLFRKLMLMNPHVFIEIYFLTCLQVNWFVFHDIFLFFLINNRNNNFLNRSTTSAIAFYGREGRRYNRTLQINVGFIG